MPLPPPVIKIVLLVSFIIKYPPKLCDHLQIALHVDETAQKVDGRSSNKRLGSSIAAARTKASNAPETVEAATPAMIGSSLRMPETKVKDAFSLMNGIAS